MWRMKVPEKNVRINICTKNLNNGTLQYDLKLDWLGNGAHAAAIPLVLLDAALIYNFLLWGILVHLTKWFLRLGSRDRIVRFFHRMTFVNQTAPVEPSQKRFAKRIHTDRHTQSLWNSWENCCRYYARDWHFLRLALILTYIVVLLR